MSKTQRIILFIIASSFLFLIFYLSTGKFIPSSEQSIVLLTALLTLSFVTFFLEHFFTTPTDVLASTISILLLMAPLQPQLANFGVWYWIFFGYNLLLLLTSLTALLLLDSRKSSIALQNRLSAVLKRFSVSFGNGRFLFFALFFLTLVFYVDSQSYQFLVLAAYAAAILLVDPKGFVLSAWRARRIAGFDVGEIIGVQSRNTFLAKLYSGHVPVRRFDLAEFRYSMADDPRVFKGMIVDNYLLNEQQWIKILATEQINRALIMRSRMRTSYTKLKCKMPPSFLGDSWVL